MKTLVVDASVGVKWQLDDEEHVDKAEAIKGAFVRRALTLMVPVIFAVEWANALNVAIVRGRFPAEAWQEALEDLDALQLSVGTHQGYCSKRGRWPGYMDGPCMMGSISPWPTLSTVRW